MSLEIVYSARFRKHYRSLNDQEKKQFRNKLNLFSENPMHPSLRTKRIQGTDELFEFSVNMDIRVIWYHEEEKIVALVDIGHHDILANY